MTTSAMLLMIFSVTLIWGGLIAAIIHLVKNPDVALDEIPED